MKDELRIKPDCVETSSDRNEEFRMGAALLLIGICLAAIITLIKVYDWDSVERMNLADRSNQPMIKEYDGCTYIRFAHRHEFIHKANCSNPEHKTEGK